MSAVTSGKAVISHLIIRSGWSGSRQPVLGGGDGGGRRCRRSGLAVAITRSGASAPRVRVAGAAVKMNGSGRPSIAKATRQIKAARTRTPRDNDRIPAVDRARPQRFSADHQELPH